MIQSVNFVFVALFLCPFCCLALAHLGVYFSHFVILISVPSKVLILLGSQKYVGIDRAYVKIINY